MQTVCACEQLADVLLLEIAYVCARECCPVCMCCRYIRTTKCQMHEACVAEFTGSNSSADNLAVPFQRFLPGLTNFCRAYSTK